MYYIIFGLLYLVSLLPFFILYRLSDVVYFLLFYVFGYRKDVVMGNLNIAFPEKTAAEKKAIAKQFYKNLIDTFIESIKMISMGKSQFEKRCTTNLLEVIKALESKGRSIQLHGGHQMNWEYANWILSKNISIPFIGIYQPISNAAMNKIFFNLRSRFNTQLISTKEFKARVHNLFKGQYAIGLVADQNSTDLRKAYWMYFFSQPVAFVTGPDKGAIKNNTAVVFVNFIKKRRGCYQYEAKVVTEDASAFEDGVLTRMYRDFLEDAIRLQPANYLWSHRRWRHPYHKEYENLWMDTKPAP